MFEFVILVVVAVISYHVGAAVLSYQLRHLIHKEARRLGLDKSDDINVLEEADPEVSQLIIEKTNDTLYLYDINHSFICQGKTIDELAKLAKQYKYGFVDGTVKIYSEIVK